ncbi:MAG: Unknown protein [uncultured Sulfurovum sp.]|uniref:Endonuclease GajA/Old nuclease/RecF-like AAA domain-containing protein n=1 Tax=uncultured Sulfurovum sp. TaxID=269237 RepID=A0A6S6UDF7_9BACT|nr:MAG: Unknown protein [uncultured Sulfurovum sp.]
MEQLRIKNFLVIKNAKFDVGKINIIIGPQANGKSILVKLLYLFRETISESFLISVKNNELQKDFLKKIEESFEKYFPHYTWKNKDFQIIYIRDDIEIKISKTNTQRKIKIELSEYLTNQFRGLKSQYKKFLKQKKDDDRFIYDDFWEFKDQYIDESQEVSKYFSESIFIPASRSFFANLQKNIFSFLAENIDIDPFMKEFGSKYELAKNIHANTRFNEEIIQRNKSNKQFKEIVENILNGKYEYKDKQDWITSKGEMINVANTSSGQQESLPMLLILSIFPFVNDNKVNMYFIEEPEAHLFPVSQKHLVSLFGLIYNNDQDSVITTHSPYILTALNNLLLAYDIKEQKGKEALKDIIDEEFCINFDDIRAYTIEKGKLISIMDKEERLIGMNIIDSVSDEFSNTFDTLLSMQDYE